MLLSSIGGLWLRLKGVVDLTNFFSVEFYSPRTRLTITLVYLGWFNHLPRLTWGFANVNWNGMHHRIEYIAFWFLAYVDTVVNDCLKLSDPAADDYSHYYYPKVVCFVVAVRGLCVYIIVEWDWKIRIRRESHCILFCTQIYVRILRNPFCVFPFVSITTPYPTSME